MNEVTCTNPSLDPKFLEERSPIWNAISKFYLDTELDEHDYTYIAKIFVDSGLSFTVLKEIDLYEVFPVLKTNLMSVAGIWSGFDDEWLKERCTVAFIKKENAIFRWKTRFQNRLLFFQRKQHWAIIEKRMKASQKGL